MQDTAIILTKLRLPIHSLGLNEKLDDSTVKVLEQKTFTPVSFRINPASYPHTGQFLDGGDGYWYGLHNKANSSGNATLTWIKISQSDFSFTEGKWTLSNVQLLDCRLLNSSNTIVSREIRSAVKNDFLYLFANNKKGIYKINLGNQADVTLIPLGFKSALAPLGESISCELYLTRINDMIMGGDFILLPDDTVRKTAASKAKIGGLFTPLFPYKEFLFGWGGSSSYQYRYSYLLMPYIVTINNLS